MKAAAQVAREPAMPPRAFFLAPSPVLARRLLGCVLTSDAPGGLCSGIIVETEAYTREDPASHSRMGPTARNRPMFEGGGLAYVYFVYGMHCCFNVTAGGPGDGEAVLVRAVEPLDGLDAMMQRRGTREVRLLASGPGRLCSAMGIGLGISGTDLSSGPVRVLARTPELSPRSIASSPRIGVRAAADRPWRFYVRDSPFLSRRCE